MERGEFEGKTAIVTGSAMGIGAAVALALARGGARIVVNYSKSMAEAEAIAASIQGVGSEAVAVKGDVASDEDCRALVAAAMDRWGRLDILVNNAATTKFARGDKLDSLSAEDFARIYAVNVIGPFQMIRAAAPLLKASGEGAVVNVSSIAGFAGGGSSIAYDASKGALNTMTMSLARVLAPEIRVNAVCPGYVATRWFSDRVGHAAMERISRDQLRRTPLKRVGAPDDIADAILFFCGRASRHITGELLAVDAGLHLSSAPGGSLHN